MGNNPDYRVAVIVPEAGASFVEPNCLHVAQTSGTLEWAIHSAIGSVEKARIEFNTGTAITFPNGSEKPVVDAEVPANNPYKKQGFINANVPETDYAVSVVQKYTVMLLKADDTEIARIDPWIITDTP